MIDPIANASAVAMKVVASLPLSDPHFFAGESSVYFVVNSPEQVNYLGRTFDLQGVDVAKNLGRIAIVFLCPGQLEPLPCSFDSWTFDGATIRFVDGLPIAYDVAAFLGYKSAEKLQERPDTYSVYDLLAISVEFVANGEIDKSHKVFDFISKAGLVQSAAAERLYHACRIHETWANKKKSECASSLPQVYLIGCSDNKSLKIGYTTNLQKRLQGLQVSSSYKLRIIAAIPGTPALERQLHKEFAHLALSGEWFRWSEEIIEKFDHLGGQDNP